MSDTESAAVQGGESLKQKLREELRKYLVVSAYLFICFGVLQLYKPPLRQVAGVHSRPLGGAGDKAGAVWLDFHSDQRLIIAWVSIYPTK